MRKIILLAFLTSVLFSIGCNNNSTAKYERAHDPWVFRSVLDSLPRMLTIALNDNLWAAYSAQTGALYKVWRGGVNFDGAVYTTVHGPQPSTLGDAWLQNRFDQPWSIVRNGKAEQPTIQFRGHRFHKGQVTINADLQLADGTVIKVHETPEYVTNEQGLTGFERTFTLENVPAGAQVLFKTNFHSIAFERSIQTKGGDFKITKSEPHSAKGLSALDVEGQLFLNPNGATVLTAFFVKNPLLENPNKIQGAETEENVPLGMRLIARSDCKTCHNTYLKTIGPSYVDVAKKYLNTPANVAMLAGKVKNGGSGVWGEAAMTAHPELEDRDINEMVKYIMSLDAEEEALFVKASGGASGGPIEGMAPATAGIGEDDLLPGAFVKVFQFDKNLEKLADVNFKATPVFTGAFPVISAADSEFQGLESNFALEITGYLNIPKTNNYVFRLTSDDGSRLYIDDKEIIDFDGLHGGESRDGEIALEKGFHPFRIEYFQGGGGKVIRLEWNSPDLKGFSIVPTTALRYDKTQVASAPATASLNSTRIPGDKFPLQSVHPSYDLSQARPDEFAPKVGGMDFLPDGRLVVSTWDAEGAVYIVDGVQSGDPAKMSYKKIAKGLAEPLGLKVVDGEIYVLQKQELTRLIDHDGDEVIDEYYTLSNDWRVSANFHEFAFGLAYKDDYFYAALAIAILPGGASANPQIPDRGKAVRISKSTGKLEVVAEGFRTPNGVGIGVDGEIFIADNQGDWLPSSKILHVTKGAFFASRAVDSARVAQLPVKLPVVWLPQDEIGNSPTTPLAINDGPYKGQMIHSEVTHGGVKRVFVEKINGEYQGCVFRFIQGLEAGINRMVWGPDGALYVGGIGSTGNWRQEGKEWYGLQRLKYNEKPTFEMLAVRAKSNGMEIEFTEPLAEGLGWNPTAYTVQQWYYLPTHEYGGPKLGLENLRILSANVSDDRKKVFLELAGLKPNHVVYIRLPYEWTSANELELWATEAWYTLNQIPADNPGFRTQAPPPVAANTLSETERKAGWKLLFDGKTLDGWRNYNKQTLGASWKAMDGALVLDAVPTPTGGWGVPDGGDIVLPGEYANFDLQLEWKISPCGNSGIMYYVVESEQHRYPWLTGPEMQILDNACHPDARIDKHRAGDLYDLIACKYETVKPAGEWNKVRIIAKDGKVEHWLNGRKVVATELWTREWNRLVADSKFKEMPDFAKAKKGRIVLQDHRDARVAFRNIKIREL